MRSFYGLCFALLLLSACLRLHYKPDAQSTPTGQITCSAVFISHPELINAVTQVSIGTLSVVGGLNDEPEDLHKRVHDRIAQLGGTHFYAEATRTNSNNRGEADFKLVRVEVQDWAAMTENLRPDRGCEGPVSKL